jgi:MFS family permease
VRDVNRNDRAITGLVMLAHSLVHTYEFVFPVFIPIWLSQFGTTAAIVGGIVGIGLSLFGLGAPLSGVLTDRRGSKPLIVVCLLGMGCAFVLLSLSTTLAGFVGTSRLPIIGIPIELAVVALALIIWGSSASLYHPAGLSLITRGVEERGSAFAYHGTAGNIGTALGPFIATILLFLLNDSWEIVAAILAVPALLGVALAVRIDVNETAAVSTATDGGTSKASPGSGISSLSEFLSLSKTLLSGAFLVVFAAVMLSGLYYRGMLTFLPSLLREIQTIKQVSLFGQTFHPANYLYTGLLAMGVSGQYVGGKLTDRLPVELGLTVGYSTLGVIAILFLPVASIGVLPFLSLLALLGFSLFFVQPFYQATVAEYSPASARGLSYGYTYLAVFGVGAIGAPLAGIALTYLPRPYLFGILAGFGFVAGGLGLFLLTRGR